MPLHPAVYYLVLAAVVLVVCQRTKRRSVLPLPPGPPRLPIIGNALDMPKENVPERLHEMSTKHGDVVYLEVLGQPMVILGTHEAALDLLEKRSANYSDRSPSPMIELSGFGWALPVQGYGTRWRRHRRAFHQYFNSSAIAAYKPANRLEAHRFVQRLMDTPDKFLRHIRHYFGSAIIRVTYGLEVDTEPRGMEYLTIAEELMEGFSSVFAPGKYLVEVFPILRFLPKWLPGAQFKHDGEDLKHKSQRLLNVPWEAAMEAVRGGTSHPSMAVDLTERARSELSPAEAASEEEVVQNTAANAYAGGADTTLSTVQTFFTAMLLFPEVQKKAQAELTAVVGAHRLPEFDDEPSLPYVCALIKELLRWRSVVPLSVPHRSVEDDEYRGYSIPKGTIVISNIWAYSRDPVAYPDPEAFMPERFLKDGKLNPDVQDPAAIAFGYGRRICPGRHYAESSLFMIVSSVLHTLNITAPIGADGKPVLPSGKMVTGLLAYPEPFSCVLKARSKEAETLIRASCKEGIAL